MVDREEASVQDIDKAMRLGAGRLRWSPITRMHGSNDAL